MKKLVAILTCILLVVSVFPISAAALQEDIIILYENDVHCAIEGYSKLAAMKKELQQSYTHVGVVSGGDYIQGNSLGVISTGAYMISLMNLIGYDAAALGNHEFDFRLDRLNELVGMMDVKAICCNFQQIGAESSYFKPYTIVSYGEVDIAYIGITTPTTISSSSPTQFKDDNGEFLYTFNADILYEIVQNNIDAAKAEGADYIIALSHIGYADDEIYGDLADIETLIGNTNGLDVVLDAHSHSVMECKEIPDQGGNTVLLSSTGTKFEYIGKLTISDGTMQTELIETADYQNTDPEVDAYIAQIYEEYAEMGERKVAVSEVELNTHDADGKRLVRTAETNLGDLCADAFRYAVNADIGYINGGGLRAAIPCGDITFNDLLNVLPFNNTVVLAEVSGQTMKDMLEMSLMTWPAEDGAFPHLSGITFSFRTDIPSSVEINAFEEFESVSGEYRVYDIQVYNRETEVYEPLDLTRTYTLAASNYYLLDYGSGMTMLENAVILQNDGILDVEALERYVSEVLGGVIGTEYAEMKPNILFVEHESTDTPEINDTPAEEDGMPAEEDDMPEAVETPEINDTPETDDEISEIVDTPEFIESETAEEDAPETADASGLIVWVLTAVTCLAVLADRKKAAAGR